MASMATFAFRVGLGSLLFWASLRLAVDFFTTGWLNSACSRSPISTEQSVSGQGQRVWGGGESILRPLLLE